MKPLSGEAATLSKLLPLFLFAKAGLSEKGSTLKRKAFAPFGSNFFSVREDPCSENDWCAAKQTGSHKSCLPCPYNSLLSNYFIYFTCVGFGALD